MIKNQALIKELYNNYFLESSGVSIDSRTLTENQIFFAIRGDRFDGHEYVQMSQNKGACKAVIDNPQYFVQGFTILVPDVIECLQSIANYHRHQIPDLKVLALTGSNGKTTTKELLFHVLDQKYLVLATEGNLNNHLGVPLTLLRLTQDCDIAIIEMGANHPGEIDFLCRIADPDFGLITNIGMAHLEGFGDIEGVRKAKTELYKYLEKKGGEIFYNVNDKMLLKSLDKNTLKHPYNPDDILVISGYPSLKLQYSGRTIHSALTGDYNVTNIMAAIKVGEHFKIDLEDIVKGIEAYHPANNRSQVIHTDTNTIILDAYNANPSSMKASIDNLVRSPSSKKVLILGHMLELGDSSQLQHQILVDYIKQYTWEKVFLIGEEFFKTGTSYPVFKDVKDFLTGYLIQNPISGCTVLLKGSRGIALEKILDHGL